MVPVVIAWRMHIDGFLSSCSKPSLIQIFASKSEVQDQDLSCANPLKATILSKITGFFAMPHPPSHVLILSLDYNIMHSTIGVLVWIFFKNDCMHASDEVNSEFHAEMKCEMKVQQLVP